MEEYIGKILAAAKESGIEPAEVYTARHDSFRAMCQNKIINPYTVSSTRGLCLRGIWNGKMGYASTEAFDEEAIDWLIAKVKESAELNEEPDVQEIYPGDKDYPEVDQYAEGLDAVSAEQKLNYLRKAEEALLAADSKIAAANYNMLSTASSAVQIENTYGLKLKMRDNIAFSYLSALAKEEGKASTGSKLTVSRNFGDFDPEKAAKAAAEQALFMLGAAPVTSGSYRAIFHREAMSDLLGVFWSIFSAENVQQNMSLLKDKEGQLIASEAVTLLDDPLRPGGFSCRGFDDEGVRSRTKKVIDHGVLVTLLHNLKTAKKAGCASTGNGMKASYASPVRVAPTNFFLAPGEKSLEELMQAMGDGLVITEVSGLHAGANPLSGDFSLIAEGYTVKNGTKDSAVEQITVAGNFYTLLKSIREVGNDLDFPGSSIGSPSVDVGEIAVAGK